MFSIFLYIKDSKTGCFKFPYEFINVLLFFDFHNDPSDKLIRFVKGCKRNDVFMKLPGYLCKPGNPGLLLQRRKTKYGHPYASYRKHFGTVQGYHIA